MLSNRERTSTLILSSLLSCALLVACDKQDTAKQDDKPAEKTEDEKAVEARVAAKKAEREAAAKAEEEKANAVKALAELPEKMPKNLEAACSGVAEAQDEFMQRNYEGDGLQRWNEAKATQLGVIKTGCVKSGNIEVAACQINAMNNAPGEYKNELPNILKACIDKYGGHGGEPG